MTADAGASGAMPAGTPAYAVIDTNVWLDWLVFQDPVVEPLRQAAGSNRLQPIGSAQTRDELAHVLRRPHIAARLADVDVALAEFDRRARVVQGPPADCGLACTDPADQVFIDLAVAVGARWLISKDKALLALASRARRRFAIEIVTPKRLGLALAETGVSGRRA